MKIASMQRLSQIDEMKIGIDVMKWSISKTAENCSKLYYLQIGDINKDIIEHIESLNKPFKITKSVNDYGIGWIFKNNESLDDLYKTVDESFDWILYPDMDTILPENILDLMKKADEIEAKSIRFHYIECFGSIDDIIEIKTGFPIGPHFAILKPTNGLTFIGSDGFSEPTSNNGRLKRYETQYCMRHLRYLNTKTIDFRKNINYFQDYFLQEHQTIKYQPSKTLEYYQRL
jgi:hypothetical protein